MDGHASRKLLVSSFGLFGLVTGLIIYFQPFTESEWYRFLFNLNFPASLVMVNLEAMVNNATFGKVLLFSQYPVLAIPVSAAAWSTVGFILNSSVKFFAAKNEI